MLAIQANEQGHPVLVEAVEDGGAYFREVDAERWREIVAAELGISDAPRAVVPMHAGENDHALPDVNRLLDNGHAVVIFKNQINSYTAFASNAGHEDLVESMEDADEDGNLTDDFTPEAVMRRLADKVLRVGEYG